LERKKTYYYKATIVGVFVTYATIELFLIFKMNLCYFASFLQISLKQKDMLNAIHYPKCMGKQKCFNLFALFGQPIHHIYSGIEDEEGSQTTKLYHAPKNNFLQL
jgi:hypothetical protein